MKIRISTFKVGAKFPTVEIGVRHHKPLEGGWKLVLVEKSYTHPARWIGKEPDTYVAIWTR